jgi:hypothetical protein
MHQFWSSHEEKRDCVRLSMGGQPWLELELMAGHGELVGEGKEGEGEGEGAGGTPEGARLGDAKGALQEEGSTCCCVRVCCCCCFGAERTGCEKQEEGKRKEKERRQENKGKEKRKKEKTQRLIFN